METKHTELDWDYAENPDCQNAQHDRFLVRCKTEYPDVYGTVAMCGYKPNAEFIVRACNAHYDLLEALENILNVGMSIPESVIWDGIRQAIAKVKGGK